MPETREDPALDVLLIDDDSRTITRALELGDAGHLPKPPDYEGWVGRARKVWERRLQYRERKAAA